MTTIVLIIGTSFHLRCLKHVGLTKNFDKTRKPIHEGLVSEFYQNFLAMNLRFF